MVGYGLVFVYIERYGWRGGGARPPVVILIYYLQTKRFFHLKTPPVTFLRVQRVPGEGSAAGLRPFLHGGTGGRGRPFVLKAACTSRTLYMVSRKTESRTVLFGDGTSTDLAGFSFAKEN